MNWLNKISQHKPMALPAGGDTMNLMQTNRGIRDIDREMEQSTADELDKRFPYIDLLGAGQMGVAYDCMEGVVCKISNDRYEIAAARQAMRVRCPAVAQVYKVEQIQRSPLLWVIMIKKVQALSKTEQFYYAYMPEHLPEDDVSLEEYMIKMNRGDNVLGNSPIDVNLIRKIHRASEIMEASLKEFGFSIRETHESNVGWDGDRLVLFDLGGSINI